MTVFVLIDGKSIIRPIEQITCRTASVYHLRICMPFFNPSLIL
jgi:hypothetical protein